MMITFIESLPQKEQQNFDTQQLPGLVEVYQKAFNCLSLAFTTASVSEPDMIGHKAEEVREVLAWLDDQLFDFRQRQEEQRMNNPNTQKDEK